MHKSASLSLSKHQKKKDKANARKGVSIVVHADFVKTFLSMVFTCLQVS